MFQHIAICQEEDTSILQSKIVNSLSCLYSNHIDIFDIRELNYLRRISNNLFFIRRLANANSSDLEKSDDLTNEVWKKYSELVDEMIGDLLGLIIKWNYDGITDIKLK